MNCAAWHVTPPHELTSFRAWEDHRVVGGADIDTDRLQLAKADCAFHFSAVGQQSFGTANANRCYAADCRQSPGKIMAFMCWAVA